MNWKTFFICGLTGWCMEILFTSLGGLLRGDLLLNGHTSIWMFPIYGLAAVIGSSFRAPAPLACASARLFLRCRHYAR